MFRNGNIPWNKGLKAETDERVKANIAKSAKTFRERGYKTRLGIKHTDETKEKIRKAATGRKGYWKGKSIPEETRAKIREARLGQRLSLEHRLAISKGLEKGGVTNLNKDYGLTRMNYQQWRKAILERDKHQCQLCFFDGLFVAAHHIMAFDFNVSLRYEVSNGITLCRKCHNSLHNFSLLLAKAVKTGKLQLLQKLLKALDNPVPILNSNILEGVTTNSRVLRDSNADTSAVPEKKGMI